MLCADHVHHTITQHVKAWTGTDPLLVRAYIPAALLAQMADREQQADDTTQGYKLAVRIASDFQVGCKKRVFDSTHVLLLPR